MQMFRFEDINEPRMVGLIVGNGSGSKLLQSYIDGHEQIYMVPAYPLFYFYPHWESWVKQYGDMFDWQKAISLFCEKHASVLDSRRIPGFNGLTSLGDSRNEYLSIDEPLFRNHLAHLLEHQPVNSRTFLLAVHYAYALCNGEDLTKKTILVYHIHIWEFLVTYLSKDFPDLKIIAMTRDPRANLERRLQSLWKVDKAKLDSSDAKICQARNYYWTCKLSIFNGLEQLNRFDRNNVIVIKHEDMGRKLETVMRCLAHFLEIKYLPLMLHISFGGKSWWSDPVYGRTSTNTFNPKILSEDWKKTIGKIDWFVIEGVMYHYFIKYKTQVFLYQKDTVINRILLLLAILVPSRIERSVFAEYCHPRFHIQFIKACIDEAFGKVKLMDYTWNASYLFKPIYLELELWKPRHYRMQVKELSEKKQSKWSSVQLFIRVRYVVIKYARFLGVIVFYPGLIFKRWGLCYGKIFNQWKAKSCPYPDGLESHCNRQKIAQPNTG
ncbi:MAG: sulfotransferase [Pseudomonadota bacterium]